MRREKIKCYKRNCKGEYTINSFMMICPGCIEQLKKEQLLEILDNGEWSNGEILEYINNKLKQINEDKPKSYGRFLDLAREL